LLAFTGILVNLGKPFHQRDVFRANPLRQVVHLFDECFELVRVVFLHRLGYLRIELLDIAKLLRFYFIAADDLDDFLNLRQCWLWCGWRLSPCLA
jgi:hypothetical protein